MKVIDVSKRIITCLFLFWGITQVLYAQDNSLVPENSKALKKQLKEQAVNYEKIGKIDSAIIAYEKLLSMDTTLNLLNFEIGRLWNKLGSQKIDTTMLDNSIKYFETYLSNFKIKSKEHPKGEKDSTGYHKAYQNVLEIQIKNLSLKQQIRALYEYDSLLKTYEGYWVSYFFSKERMVPQWILHFVRDSVSKTLSVELHRASFRFSNETQNQKFFPMILKDGGLAFRLSRQKTFMPSQSAYYMKHLFVDISNPTYKVAIESAKGKQYNRPITEDWIEKQKEIDAKMHAQLENKLKLEIASARIEKAEEEFIIKPISDSIMYATCREIIANPAYKKGGVVIDTTSCVFYKIPDDMIFIILGRRNIRFENKKHSKDELKYIGFTKWNNLSITGNVFGHVGYLTIGAALTVGYSPLWELYRIGILMFQNYIESAGTEKMMRNPRKWNTKMYNTLLDHYNPGEKLKLESPIQKAKKETKKEKKKREQEELANTSGRAIHMEITEPKNPVSTTIAKADTLPTIQKEETTQHAVHNTQEDNKNSQSITKNNIEIEAIDYVTNLKDLVSCFDNKRITFAEKVKKWEEHLNPYIEKMIANNTTVIQTKKELNEANNKKVRKDINKKLKSQEKIYKQSIKDLQVQGVSISAQLKTYSKQETESINQQFKNVSIKIEPTTLFPATSKEQKNIIFSNRIENLQTLAYLKSTEELLYWYQRVEHSFLQIIEYHNQKAKVTIQKDKDLEAKQKTQNTQLAEYQKESKKYKKEIGKLKKVISQTEKERKEVSNQMRTNSKELTTKLKEYNKEIQKTFNQKIKTIIQGVDYQFQKLNDK